MSQPMFEPSDPGLVDRVPGKAARDGKLPTPRVPEVADHPVFRLFDDATQEKLLMSGQARTIEPGDTMAINGCVTFVQDGLLGTLFKTTGVCVGVSGAGAVVGLESGFDAPRDSHIVALASSRVFSAPAAVLIDVLGRSRVMELCMRQSFERLNAMEAEAACNASHLVPQRMAKWLLRLHRANQEADLSLTQAALARLIGIQRTSVNAAARDLQQAGAARFTRGRIVIRDIEGLSRSACACSV